jgi:predicted DNA-binding protein YlxM (UPF0122 family)
MTRPKDIKKEDLQQLYYKEEKTLQEIADIFGCSLQSIFSLMNKYNLKRRDCTFKTKVKIEKYELEKLYYEEEHDMPEIAKMFNCSRALIALLMEKYGLKKRKSTPKFRAKKEELERLHIDNNLSLSAIGRIFHRDCTTIKRRMESLGIPIRYKKPFDIDRIKLEKLYVNDNPSKIKIAKLCGCGVHVITRLLRKYGLEIKNRNNGNTGGTGYGRPKGSHNKKRKLDWVTKKYAKSLYYDINLSVPNISKKFGCSSPIVYNRLKELEIPIKSIKEALKTRNLNGKNNPNYIDGRSNFINLLRSSGEYKNWRREVFKRDNYTCQECGTVSIGNIEAHHKIPIRILIWKFLKLHNNLSLPIDKDTLLALSENYEPFWDVNNGQTLCEDCHKKESINTLNKIKLVKI